MTTYYTNAFANFYERYNTGWIREFAPLLPHYLARTQTTQHSLLDLCCGTGVSTAIFCEAGWHVIGLDHSPGMLHIAQEKLATMIKAGKVSLMEAEATHFTLPNSVGACICLDGALNHLDSLSQLKSCFASVGAALLDDGQFVFDLYEPSHFHHWDHVTMIDDPDVMVVKRGVWDEQMQQGMLRVSGALGTGSTCLRIEQTLYSRIFTTTEVEDTLASVGLVRVECEIENTSKGMRPEALYSQAPARIIYRALKKSAHEKY